MFIAAWFHAPTRHHLRPHPIPNVEMFVIEVPGTYVQMFVLQTFHLIGVCVHLRCFPFADMEGVGFENIVDTCVLVQGFLNVQSAIMFKVSYFPVNEVPAPAVPALCVG